MESRKSCISSLQIILIIFHCGNCMTQRINFGSQSDNGVLPENPMTLHTCCDLPLDPAKWECPDTLKPLPEPLRLKQWEIPSQLTLDKVPTRVGLTRNPLPCHDTTVQEFQIDDDGFPLEIEFQPDGYLMIGNRTRADYIHPGSYCFASISPNKLKIRSCKPKCNKEEPCIRKCCPRNQLIDLYQVGKRCVVQSPPSSQWSPKLYSKPSNPNSQINLVAKPEIRPRIQLRAPPTFGGRCPKTPQGNPMTHNSVYSIHLNLTPPDIDVFEFNARLGSDGRLYHRNLYRNWEALPDEEYCSDGGTILNDESHVYKDTMDETIFILCVMDEAEEQQASNYYAALAITCSMFALITVLAYFLLLDKQNIHGWTTMSHSSAVFFLFIFLGVAHLTKEHEHIQHTFICEFVGMASHYFWMAVFCWLLVLSFDLWMTFKSLSVSGTRRGCRRFFLYSLFGWGFPLLFVLGSLGMDIAFADDINTEIVVPMYGHSFCYITRYALLQYLYIPSAILFAINMGFFVLTAWTLYHYQKSTKMATKNMQKNRQSFMLYVKLFMVAGMLWVIELVSFLVSGAHVPWYVQVADTLNVLQPVFIFKIFVLKWEIINALHEKYIWIRPIVYPARVLLKRYRRKDSRPNVESTALNSRVNDTEISRISHASDTPPVANSGF